MEFSTHVKAFFRRHSAGLAISLVISLIIGLPPVIWRFSDGYQGVDMLKTNTETHYVAQVQEIYDGHSSLGNPFFGGALKDEPYLFPPLSPHLVAAFGRVLGLTAVEAVMTFRFIATAMLSFMIYLFVLALTGRRAAALMAAPGVLLGYQLIDPANLFNLIRGQDVGGEHTFIDYGRPINPQVSSLFFFSYLAIAWRAIMAERTRRGLLALAAGILGLSFFVYLYTWSFILALNGCLVLVYALAKDWRRVRRLLLISAGGLVIAIPYLVHVYEVSRHPWYAEVAPRFGIIATHAPNFSLTVAGSILLFILSKGWFTTPVRRFFWALWLAAVIVVNEQVITGQYLFNHHYHWYYTTPLVIIFFSTFAVTALERWRVKRSHSLVFCAVVITLFLYNGFMVQKSSYAVASAETAKEQRYAPLLEWIDTEAKKEAVYLSPHNISGLIVSYTSGNVYYHGTGIYTLVPDEQLLRTYLVYQYLSGRPADSFAEYLKANEAEVVGFVYGYRFAFQPGVCSSCLPPGIAEKLAHEYASLSDATFLDYLRQYPIDYIVWDKQQHPEWVLERLELPVEAEFDGITVYRVPPK